VGGGLWEQSAEWRQCGRNGPTVQLDPGVICARASIYILTDFRFRVVSPWLAVCGVVCWPPVAVSGFVRFSPHIR
jgi:hypothetical protein